MGIGSLSGVNRPGRGVDYPTLSSAKVVRKTRAIPLIPLWVFMAGYTVNFTFHLL
jgi:hypothetical protein